MKRLLGGVCSLLVALAPVPAWAETNEDTVAAAIATIRDLDRPGRDNLATAWDGNKYVQCRHTPDNTIRCEAAGSLMQVSLERVLTPQRVDRLKTMGWLLDKSFGNYVKTFGPTATAESIAEDVLAALSQGYDADLRRLDVQTTSIRREACPPRNGPSQNLAGLINDAPSMAGSASTLAPIVPAAKSHRGSWARRAALPI